MFRRQQEIDRAAAFVDGAVQLAPLAANLDVGFVNPDRTTVGSAERAKPLLDDGCIGQDPPVDRAVVDLEAAFPEHLLRIAVT